MIPEVDNFLNKAKKWEPEMRFLCELAADCGLTETIKWGVPCYTFNNNNVILINGFKEYCALNFIKGALLADPDKVFIQQTENVQATRQMRFTSLSDIKELSTIIRKYLYESIEVEKQGLKIEYKKVDDFDVPEELEIKFNQNPAYKEAFKALTPGRQKGYLLHFSQAKQSATRESRIEKCTERILKGKGLDDCVCGRSKRYPRCDGSHNRPA